IPVLKANLLTEKSPFARMSYVIALLQLGDRSYIQPTIDFLKSTTIYYKFFDARGGDTLPISLKQFPYSDYGGRFYPVLNSFTLSLLALTQVALTSQQKAELKSIVYQHFINYYVGYKWPVNILGRETTVAMPDHQWLKSVDSETATYSIEALCIAIDLLQVTEAYSALEEIFLALGHITPHDPMDNAFLPDISQLVITMYRLNPKKALIAFNTKLKEVDLAMKSPPLDRSQLNDEQYQQEIINPSDLPGRFIYIDQHIVDTLKEIAPEVLSQLYQVKRYKVHYDVIRQQELNRQRKQRQSGQISPREQNLQQLNIVEEQLKRLKKVRFKKCGNVLEIL
ncbi:MAG: hypothetical protein KDD40_10145, partial [Bdellovibrionales bacterium]|nr:hypothetical protein [Bdellovibrionales bacterium]